MNELLTNEVEGKIVNLLFFGMLQIFGAKSGKPRVWLRLNGMRDGRWR